MRVDGCVSVLPGAHEQLAIFRARAFLRGLLRSGCYEFVTRRFTFLSDSLAARAASVA